MKIDVNLVAFYAELAKIAYSDPRKNTKRLKIDEKIYNYEFLDESGCQAYILYNKTDFIVIIRGTSEKDDIITDISLRHERDKEIKAKVHEGFKAYSDSIYPNINKSLKINGINKKITIIGHSLGGAIAKIISLRLKQPLSCITFGEPKTFKSYPNKDLEDGKEFIRVVNNLDIICTIPHHYTHGIKNTETVLYFNRKGCLKIDPTTFYVFRDKLLTRLSFKKFFEGVDDHLINSYIKVIKKWKKGL